MTDGQNNSPSNYESETQVSIKSKLFLLDGVPCYLEGAGEPDVIAQITFSLISWCGRLGKNDPEDSCWCRTDAVVLSGSSLCLYTDVVFMPNSMPTLSAEIALDEEECEKVWEADRPSSAADVVRFLARDPSTKVTRLDPGRDLPDDFDEAKWVGKIGHYTADELQ